MINLSNKNIIHVKKENQEFLQFKKLLKYSDIITHAYSLGLDKIIEHLKQIKPLYLKKNMKEILIIIKQYVKQII